MIKDNGKIFVIYNLLQQLYTKNTLLTFDQYNVLFPENNITLREYTTVIEIMVQGGLVLDVKLLPVPNSILINYRNSRLEDIPTVIVDGSRAKISWLSIYLSEKESNING